MDFLDIANWGLFQGKGSSWYDFNYDGVTDTKDLQVIQSNLGKKCPAR